MAEGAGLLNSESFAIGDQALRGLAVLAKLRRARRLVAPASALGVVANGRRADAAKTRPRRLSRDLPGAGRPTSSRSTSTVEPTGLAAFGVLGEPVGADDHEPGPAGQKQAGIRWAMGYWGVKSYENDDADDALDAGFEQVHGDLYEELMDDSNPLSVEQVQKRLADERTLAAAVAALEEMVGATLETGPALWDEAARLGFAGVVVRHAELGVGHSRRPRPAPSTGSRTEELEWEEATKRRLRREKEIALLRQGKRAAFESPGRPIDDRVTLRPGILRRGETTTTSSTAWTR